MTMHKISIEGDYSGVITEVKLLKGERFGRESHWFRLTAETADGGYATIELDWNNEYVQNITPPVTRAEMTVQTLQNLGWRGENRFDAIPEDLTGKPINFYGKANAKGNVYFYVSSQRGEELDFKKSADELLAALTGSAPAPQPALNQDIFGGPTNGDSPF